MTLNCASCGVSFDASRPSARFCGDVCRKRGQRAKNASQMLPGAPDLPQEPVELADSPLVRVVARELHEVDRLDTVAGQVAFELAIRVANRREMGSAVASLSKQLNEAMDRAMAGVAVAADPLDEIRARRDRKRDAG